MFILNTHARLKISLKLRGSKEKKTQEEKMRNMTDKRVTSAISDVSRRRLALFGFVFLLCVSLFFCTFSCFSFVSFHGALLKTHAYFIIYFLNVLPPQQASSTVFFFFSCFVVFCCCGDFDSRNCYRCPLFCCVCIYKSL